MFFINKYYNICQNLIKKPLGGPQKMPSKLCKLCNVGKIQLKTYDKCVYALINQMISITNNSSVSYYTTKLFAQIIIRAVLKLVHPALH